MAVTTGVPDPFASAATRRLVAAALREDLGRGDVTSAATIPATARAKGKLVLRESAVVAGLPLAELIFAELAADQPPVRVRARVAEGKRAAAGRTIAELDGPLRAMLAGERVLLNLLQTLSGTATLTRTFVDAVKGTGAKILDTRKTIPGLRLLQKYAVRCGGGTNHRFGLDDGVLIKDNHIVGAGSVRAAVTRARAAVPHGLKVEIECDQLSQVREALAAGADIVLLDNMTPGQVARCCEVIAGRAVVEVSGGLTIERVREYAEAGAELLSIGRLTHSAPAIDIGLDLEMRKRR
ncbi:MAG: carboxylating nicotinate-nucleotide diphosphorylase [Deltaproteobacteria bacterium]